MKEKDISIEDLGKCYLDMVDDMCQARLDCVRLGHYPVSNLDEAVSSVYDNEEVMVRYMLGLGLSQFLWSQHFDLFKFYRQVIRSYGLSQKENFLEIGSGHGLFLFELFKAVGLEKRLDVVDISKTSINISKDFIKSLYPNMQNKVHFIHSDIVDYSPSKKYDFITMGEVLEHVPDPVRVLEGLRCLLCKDGVAYISTAVNSPALDHIYHFHSTDEIRVMLRHAGFEVLEERIAPAEDYSPEKLEKYKVDILYGAAIRRNDNG